MSISLEAREGEEVLLKPTGDIAANYVSELRTVLRKSVEAKPAVMTLDLSDVKTIDASGVGLLIAASNSMGRTGGRVMVTNVSDEIAELLRALRIHQLFGVASE